MTAIKGDRFTVSIDDGIEKMVEKLIRESAPEAIKIFESALAEIKTEAKASWPVRQKVRIMRDESGAIVRRKNGKPVIFKNPPSRRSIDKFKITTKIQGSQIVVSLENSAPYSYLIRMGIDTKGQSGREIFLPLASRVWDKVVFSPVKKQSKKVASDYADELMRLQKG